MVARCLMIAVLLVAVNGAARPGFGQADAPPNPTAKQDDLAKLGFERRSITVDDAKLSYVLRKGSGPTLVLIPGSFDRAESYLGVVARLDPELQILIVELRGHGKSWPPPTAETGTIERFAADVFAVADDAELRSFFIGGHSIGGMVAIECARRQPQRLKGVISIEGWTCAAVLEEAFQGTTDSTLSAAQKIRKLELRRPTTERWTAEQTSAFARIWRTWNGAETLKHTSLPVLELWGDRGKERPARAQLQLPDRPNIVLKWVSGASHFLPLERPTETAQAAQEFIIDVEEGRLK